MLFLFFQNFISDLDRAIFLEIQIMTGISRNYTDSRFLKGNNFRTNRARGLKFSV